MIQSYKELCSVLGVDFQGKTDQIIGKVTTDTRQIQEGDVFLALKGMRADDEMMNAHGYVKTAFDNGAAYAIVSEDVEGIDPDKLICVEDTVEAYGFIGRAIRRSFKGKVIGITGSSGKTSRKEALKYVLSHFGKVYATPKNLNSQLGVPQVLCDIPQDADYAIIEMGMSKFGELQRLTEIVEPDIAIITNIYPMHLDYFDSIEQIAEGKAHIFDGLVKDGIAIYNADSNCVDILADKAGHHQKLSFGYYGDDIHLNAVHDCDVSITIKGEDVDYRIPSFNDAFLYTSLCVISVALALGLDMSVVYPLLNGIEPADGRGTIYHLNIDGKSVTLIDDAYAGGHAGAMEIGLQRLMATEGKRHIAVIGNMAELGPLMEEQHRAVGQMIDQLAIDKLFLVGEPTKWVADEVSSISDVTWVPNVEALGTQVQESLQDGDVLFVKGARFSSQVYKLVDELKKNEKNEKKGLTE